MWRPLTLASPRRDFAMNLRGEALSLLLWVSGSALQFMSPHATSFLGLAVAGVGILVAAAGRLWERRRSGLEMAIRSDEGEAGSSNSAKDRDLNRANEIGLDLGDPPKRGKR